MPFNDTEIRWTDKSTNPGHGCAKVSPGCAGCYAENTSLRYNHTEKAWIMENIDENVTIKRHYLDDYLSAPYWCFVDSMSDLFNPAIPPAFLGDVLGWLSEMDQSCFQLLTKHGPEWDADPVPMPDNVILGVSVEAQGWTYRLDWLREREAATKMVSFEPLLGPIDDVDLTGIDWAIVGGESGGVHPDRAEEMSDEELGDRHIRRPMEPEWARDVIQECREQDVAIFFKQHSGAQSESDPEIDLQDGQGSRRIEEFPTVPDGIVPAPREFLGGAVEV